jgi:hydroxymethylglutaryl-CoA synthase
LLEERRDRAPKTRDYIARKTVIDYATYARFRGKLVME